MPIRMPFVGSDDGLTALMLAVMEGHTDIVKALLAGDVDVNVRSDDGTTALKIASWNRYKEIVQLLKEAGAEE